MEIDQPFLIDTFGRFTCETVKRPDECFWSVYSAVAKALAAKLAFHDRPDERI